MSLKRSSFALALAAVFGSACNREPPGIEVAH